MTPFSGLLSQALGCTPDSLPACDYGQEQSAKNKALARFWEQHRLPGCPAPIVPAPLPRHYRSTTKRSVETRKGQCRLTFAGMPGEIKEVALLEPADHIAMYQRIGAALRNPAYRPVAEALNFLIIRGDYERFHLIFNARDLNAIIVRRLKSLAQQLMRDTKGLVACQLFFDPSQSRYFLDNKRAPGPFKMKNLAGPASFSVRYEGRHYQVPATSFSQVNHAMVPKLLTAARDLLRPCREEHLVDLYCGYGLFSHYLSPDYAHVTGLESEGLPLKAAIANTNRQNATHVMFRRCRIDRKTLSDALPGRACHRETVILDPPKQGCSSGVIEIVAQRQPEKVLHLFCGIEELPRQMNEWKNAGYCPSRIVPFDMFAGTPNLEVLVLLLPEK